MALIISKLFVEVKQDLQYEHFLMEQRTLRPIEIVYRFNIDCVFEFIKNEIFSNKNMHFDSYAKYLLYLTPMIFDMHTARI